MLNKVEANVSVAGRSFGGKELNRIIARLNAEKLLGATPKSVA
jgi:hypothetical protein